MSIFPKTLAKAFSEETDESQRASPYQTLGKIIDISIGEIKPNPVQPRRYFSPAELTSLAKSISQDGIIQPLTVRRVKGACVRRTAFACGKACRIKVSAVYTYQCHRGTFAGHCTYREYPTL